MAILKKPYELSIWSEELNSDGIKEERKEYIIGGHDMTYLGRATSLKLQRSIKGTNTLTFEMPTKFFDAATGKYVKNEYIDLLYNEQKLKLNYKGEWYEFFIKNIKEKKNFKSIIKEFTCQDSFIDELSRTGYGISFSTELYNNVEELGTFMDNDSHNAILSDSIWSYSPKYNIGDFTEYSEERFYKIPLSQFGSAIEARQIITDLTKNDFVNVNDDDIIVENLYTGETRTVKLSDDLSRELNAFWDPHYNNKQEKIDNGTILTNSNKISISTDYIYVPISDLEYIYGSVYEDITTVTEEPALYGDFTEQHQGYALQPKSTNPKSFIQFIAFEDNDVIEVDEVGNIINNDCHYVITIEEWNKILHDKFKNRTKNLIYWEENYDGGTITTKQQYNPIVIGDKIYPQNLRPSTSIIDKFNWYPVYYEGYLNELNGISIYNARKISIADRTEYNKKTESFVKVYNNNCYEFINEYSNEIGKHLTSTNDEDFRICSISENVAIVPTLARNYIQNGVNISDSTGWEGRTKKGINEENTASKETLISCQVKTTNTEKDNNIDGQANDENVGDFYLEITSPKVVLSQDMSKEGEVYSDWLINFGLVGQEKIIEKNKIYALRICTGVWNITSKDIELRNKDYTYQKDGEKHSYIIKDINDEDIVNYINLLKEYGEILQGTSTTIDLYSKLNESSTEEEIKQILFDTINTEPLNDPYKTYLSCYDINDFKYVKAKLTSDKTNELKESIINSWLDFVLEHKEFSKEYNTDLDKVLIGQGSIDTDGNYIISGTKETDNKDNYISFADLFKTLDKNELDYVVNNVAATNKYKQLYHNKKDNMWYWSENNKNGIIDHPYVLFKATTTITNPYVCLRVDSAPAEVKIENLSIKRFSNSNYSGLKLQAWGRDDSNELFLIDGISFKVYIINEDNFTSQFIEKINNGNYTYEEGDMLENIRPIWNGISSNKKPLYFTQVSPKNNNGVLDYNISEKYALFAGKVDEEKFQGIFSFKKK